MFFSEEIAQFVKRLSFEALPDTVVSHTKQRFLEVIGLCLAGSKDAVTRMISEVVRSKSGKEEATAIGLGYLTSAPDAAMVNGTSCETLEFSDTHRGTLSGVHPGSVVIPAVLAVGEKTRASGKELIVAAVAGFEIVCRIAEAARFQFFARGFHTTPICGIYGACISAGKLLGLNEEQTARALGITGSMTSGLMEFEQDGSQVKQIHDGWAAQNGILAALFAQKGLTGPKSVFEGRDGLFNAFAVKGKYQIEKLTDGLNQKWETLKIMSRAYPLCNLSAPFMEAALHLKKERSLDLQGIKEIKCFVAKEIIPIVCDPWETKANPPTPYGAKFSLPYVVALLTVNEHISIEDFTPEKFRPPQVMDLMKKVSYEIEQGRPKDSGKVEIRMKDGKVYQHEVLHKKGTLENPMTDEEVIEKYRRNARIALPENKVDQIQKWVNGLEGIRNICEVTQALSSLH